MWKRPALASLALGALLARGLAAGAVPPAILIESGPGDEFRSGWDTVLFQGVCPDPGAVFEVSRLDASGRWSPWFPAAVKRLPGGRFWGRAKLPLGAGPARVRASGAAEIFEVEAFVEGGEAREAGGQGPQASAQGGGARPSVQTRRDWEAKPPSPGSAYLPHAPIEITLHHTSGIQTKTLAGSKEEVRFIQDFHQNGRGWIDIGYHFLIDAQGNIFEGRPEEVVGAHVKDRNTGNIGISLLGTYHAPKNDPVTPEQSQALVAVGRYLVGRYGVDPASLQGHRDYRDTDCPGDAAYAILERLRARLAEPAPPAPAAAVKVGFAESLPALVRRADWDGAL